MSNVQLKLETRHPEWEAAETTEERLSHRTHQQVVKDCFRIFKWMKGELGNSYEPLPSSKNGCSTQCGLQPARQPTFRFRCGPGCEPSPGGPTTCTWDLPEREGCFHSLTSGANMGRWSGTSACLGPCHTSHLPPSHLFPSSQKTGLQ